MELSPANHWLQCEAIGHSEEYYWRYSAICTYCYEINKEFERNEA
jgi:hypothetical protein